MRHLIGRVLTYCFIFLAAGAPVDARVTNRALTVDRLAYVSSARLYVGFPKARLIPGSGFPFAPAFSPDGRWLAFLRETWDVYGPSSSRLWLARADGSDAHVVKLPGATSIAVARWSPTADVLAVQPDNAKGNALPIRLVPAQGASHTLPHNLQGAFLWSPDGRTLAVVTTSRRGYTRLNLVRGTTVRSYSIPGVGRFDPIRPAAWWPAAQSIVYWQDRGGCESCIADGTPLDAYNLRTGKTRRLGVGLIYPDWVAVSGAHLVFVAGGDRSAFFGKHLELCLATAPCRMLRGVPAGGITLDPAWRSDGRMVAYVAAPAWNTSGIQSAAKYRSWLDAHVLWTARPDGSGARRASAGIPNGAQDPQWTRDGRGILFVKGGALWLDPHLGLGSAHTIARLVLAHFVPDLQTPTFQTWYYGHMNWRDLFAWY